MQQFCHRCTAAVPVLDRPMQWCPRCGGVLSVPTTQRPVMLRWVAKPPPRAAPRVRVHQALGPTPRYLTTPGWGLPRIPWTRPSAPRPPSAAQRMGAHESTVHPLLVGAATVLALAAVGEVWRYLLLLRSRTELLPARTVAISDSVVVTAGLAALVVVIVAMVTCTLWLIRAVQAAAAGIGLRPGRRTWTVVLAVGVPVWNLLMPGVLLTELERDIAGHGFTGPSRLLRSWWAGWVLSVVLATGVWLWRLRDSVQARADGVLLAGVSDLVAAATVVLTLLLVRRYTHALAGTRVSRGRHARRWVASVPPARQARCST